MRFPILFALLMLLSTTYAQTNTDNKVVTGTVLVNDRTPVNFKSLIPALKSDWGLRLDSFNLSDKTLVLYTSGATVMLANLDYPASRTEISGAVEGAWLWRTAAEEAPRHQTQVVISAIGSPSKTLELYKLYTRVAAGVLDNTNSCGIYLASQYLLQSRVFFLQAARNLTENVLPLYCWIYFGMLQDNGASSAYTFGLREFGMPDLEIVRSTHSLQEAHAILYDAANDALQKGTHLSDGSTIETLEGQKITLKLSPAVYLNTQTLKVEY